MFYFDSSIPVPSKKYRAIIDAYRMDESECVKKLLASLQFDEKKQKEINALAKKLVEKARSAKLERTGIEALMMHYDLSTEEGIMLMCLAEALLRIPDKETEDLLIRDKLTSANWEQHIGRSESSFVKMATWGLALTGKILDHSLEAGYLKKVWKKLLRRSGEPIIRQAVREAIKVMSYQFVLGRTIEEALKRGKELADQGYTYSFDMLGEVARTQADADKYFEAYMKAIEKIGAAKLTRDIFRGPSISVKLSALYPRYEFNQRESAIPALTERLRALAMKAKELGISLTVDAEEADRLDISLEIITKIFTDPAFEGWEGLGLAVQAYQKRAYYLLDWLIDLARSQKKRIRVRLVKGAYWDTEIKLSQVAGFVNYPVFTRKVTTDLSYLACAKLMLSAQDAIYPQFATHNAYSVAAILNMMHGDYSHYHFEFQKLQGMGEALHDTVVAKDQLNLPCRIYAPVGSHKDLLPYLVRRLLENGANSSFVNQIGDKRVPIEKLISNPIEKVGNLTEIPNPRISLPKNIYGSLRLNSSGIDFSHYYELEKLSHDMEKFLDKTWNATPLHRDIKKKDKKQTVLDPSDHRRKMGYVVEASPEEVDLALHKASVAYTKWNAIHVNERADKLRKIADLLEKHRAELMVLAIREAGKTLLNAVNEIREAIDFCRYYALQAEQHCQPQLMPGPTGESNTLRLYGRGVMLCISPWNFPIAIFTGQIVASLVTGNAVIAKPAEQTPLVAARIVELCYEAGIPKGALQLLPGKGEEVGELIIKDPRINGVLFTGSTDTAKIIQKTLAEHHRGIIPLIAETGGVNAMIVDSTALPEQLVFDVLASAFDSAGQRCSALRVLYLQDDIADNVIKMLCGAMAEIRMGDPLKLSTDVGPVIDDDAKAMLQRHVTKLSKHAKLLYRVELPDEDKHGTFIAPQAYELPNLELAKREVFGPILHVIRYKAKNLDKVIDEINALGYGLTFGIHSRIDSVVDYIQSRIKAGNIYVNRNIVGAVVGVQPFGGRGLSGTGPKAGGPHYLPYLCTESTLSINTTASGGNATLMTLEDE